MYLCTSSVQVKSQMRVESLLACEYRFLSGIPWNFDPKLTTFLVWDGLWPQVARPLSRFSSSFAILLDFLCLFYLALKMTDWQNWVTAKRVMKDNTSIFRFNCLLCALCPSCWVTIGSNSSSRLHGCFVCFPVVAIQFLIAATKAKFHSCHKIVTE